MTLILRLSNTRRPLSFEELAPEFPAYRYEPEFAGAGRSFDSAKRTFERDKDDLVEMGIPLQCVKSSEYNDLDADGYLIDRARYLLPEIDLDQAEIAALAVTAAVARQQAGLSHASQLDDAWRKLSFGGGARVAPEPLLIHLPHSAKRETLEQLDAAIKHRKRVWLEYYGAGRDAVTTRDVDPYGLVYRRRTWLLAAHCHLRGALRLFRVDRIRQLKVAPKPDHPDFAVPADLDLDAFRRLSPWTFPLALPEVVTLEIDGELAAVAEEDFGPQATRAGGEGGRVRVTFPCGNLPYLTTRVLAAAGRLRVLAPEPVRRRVREQAAAIAAVYGGA